MTEFENRVAILAELWTSYRNIKEWQDFFDYNDIALPLAFMIDQKIVEANEVGIRYIDETWELLCETLTLDSKESYDDLEEMIEESKNWEEDEYGDEE